MPLNFAYVWIFREGKKSAESNHKEPTTKRTEVTSLVLPRVELAPISYRMIKVYLQNYRRGIYREND